MKDRKANRDFAIASARAFGGAIIFSLPLMMTMEMWWLGFYMDRFRLVLFLVLTVPVLAVLSHYAGFERADGPMDLVLNAFTALAVGFIASAFILVLLHVLQAGNSPDELIGKIVLQAIPGAIGAMLARSQLGARRQDRRRRSERGGRGGPARHLCRRAVPCRHRRHVHGLQRRPDRRDGADRPHDDGVACDRPRRRLPAADARLRLRRRVPGHARLRAGVPFTSEFLRLTMVAYALSLLISLYVLWTFGRTDGLGAVELVKVTLVLGFPVGAGRRRRPPDPVSERP